MARVAFNVRREGALKVKNIDAAVEAFLADANEFVRRSLKPGGHHVAVVMPHAAEPFPIAGVAPEHPVVHDGSNRQSFH